jgi:hypothetical protein
MDDTQLFLKAQHTSSMAETVRAGRDPPKPAGKTNTEMKKKRVAQTLNEADALSVFQNSDRMLVITARAAQAEPLLKRNMHAIHAADGQSSLKPLPYCPQ